MNLSHCLHRSRCGLPRASGVRPCPSARTILTRLPVGGSVSNVPSFSTFSLVSPASAMVSAAGPHSLLLHDARCPDRGEARVSRTLLGRAERVDGVVAARRERCAISSARTVAAGPLNFLDAGQREDSSDFARWLFVRFCRGGVARTCTLASSTGNENTGWSLEA